MSVDGLNELSRVLAARGLACRTLQILSAPASGRKRLRQTWRIELTDGSVIKARRLDDQATATRLRELRRDLDAAFAPVIDQEGEFLLEAWIPGTTLTAGTAGERADELGAILGRLHSTRLDGYGQRVSTGTDRQRANDDLKQLVAAGVLSGAAGRALSALLLQGEPGATSRALVHLDYCPENVVIDQAGDIHVVDNEWLSLSAPGADLGRTYSRWPMPEETWRRFLDGYRRTSPFDVAGLDFWLIAMAARSTAIRLRALGDVTAPLARLRGLAASHV